MCKVHYGRVNGKKSAVQCDRSMRGATQSGGACFRDKMALELEFGFT